MSTPKVKDTGAGFLFTWKEYALDINVTKIREHTDGRVTADLKASTSDASMNAHLLQGNINMSSFRSRVDYAKRLSQKYPKHKDSLDDVVEQACIIAMDKKQTTEPIELIIGDAETEMDLSPKFLLKPLIYLNKPNMIFAEGGVGKSTLSLIFGICVQLPYYDNTLGLEPRSEASNTLILDYEVDKEDTLLMLNKLVRGMHLPSVPLYYRKCSIPLVDDYANIKAMVKENDIKFIIIDSVAGAVGAADMKDPQAATAMLNAIRRIGGTSLLIHHTSKGDGRGKTPFGSVYFTNMCRAIYEVKKLQEEDEDSIHVMLRSFKMNLGKFIKPMGFQIKFGETTTEVYSRDPKNIVGFSGELPITTQILTYLKDGAAHHKAIAEDIGIPIDSVRQACNGLRASGKLLFQDRTWRLIYEPDAVRPTNTNNPTKTNRTQQSETTETNKLL